MDQKRGVKPPLLKALPLPPPNRQLPPPPTRNQRLRGGVESAKCNRKNGAILFIVFYLAFSFLIETKYLKSSYLDYVSSELVETTATVAIPNGPQHTLQRSAEAERATKASRPSDGKSNEAPVQAESAGERTENAFKTNGATYLRTNSSLDEITANTKSAPPALALAAHFAGKAKATSAHTQTVGGIVLNFRSPQHQPSPDAVTLITQLSCEPHDRLQVMQSLVSRWDGPASVAVFIMSPDEVEAVATLYDSDPILQKHLALHLVYMDNSTLANPIFLEYGIQSVYPVNKLRNVALANALSDWVLYVDVDFIVMPNRHDQVQPMILQELSSRKDKTVPESKLVFALPAFELSPDETSPSNKTELKRMYEDNGSSLRVFASKCKRCHGGTNYTKWLSAEGDQSYVVSYVYR
jgi:hypothetical protein